MPVEVTKDPHPEPPYERCCFCRAPTPWWYFPPGMHRRKKNCNEVACCLACAGEHEPADMPTKDEWFAAERALCEQASTRRGFYPMRIDAKFCPACGEAKPDRVGDHMRAVNRWKWHCRDCGTVFITTAEKIK